MQRNKLKFKTCSEKQHYNLIMAVFLFLVNIQATKKVDDRYSVSTHRTETPWLWSGRTKKTL